MGNDYSAEDLYVRDRTRGWKKWIEAERRARVAEYNELLALERAAAFELIARNYQAEVKRLNRRLELVRRTLNES